ncbi:hypothetical protein HK405_014852 [Cladochytrium tenue]|nr:hypothetical protein HK405_014852 [Cladochytrium tenue]
MEQCAKFASLCTATPDFPLCPGAPVPPGGSRPVLPPPAMKMYFHAGYAEYLLLRPLVPRSAAQFAAACLAIFAAAIAHEWLAAARRPGGVPADAPAAHVWAWMRARWLAVVFPPSIAATLEDSDPLLPAAAVAARRAHLAPGPLSRGRVPRAASRLAAVSLSYALMLLVMSYNVGLCAAVVLGIAVGDYLFSSDDPAYALALAAAAADEDPADCCS